MRFEAKDIVIETVDGGAGPVVLIYPNPMLRNVRAVWQGGPANCVQSGRGLRIDVEQSGEPPAADTSETSLFLAAQKAYLAGCLKITATQQGAGNVSR